MSWDTPIAYHQVESDPSKADIKSPSFLGIPTTPTPPVGVRSKQIVNAEFVYNAVSSSGALLVTTDQQWEGIKTAINEGAGVRAGFKFINNQTSGVGAMVDIENSGSYGQTILNNRGIGLSISSTGSRAIQLAALAGEAVHSISRAGANNIVLHNLDGVGTNVIASQGLNGTGFNFVGQNAGLTTFSVDKYGDILARNITAAPGYFHNHVVIKSQLDVKADLNSPNFTGIPTAPTALPGTSTNQIATTEFVINHFKVDSIVTQGSSNAVSGGAVYTALQGKQDSLGFTPENVANKNQAMGYVGLDANSKINPIYLPALPIAEIAVVNSQAEMLALNVPKGSIAIRTDINKSFILRDVPASTLSNWSELLSPTGGVQSVFGRVGVVTAAEGDYTTSLVTEGVNLYYTEARVSANIDVLANTLARHSAVTLGVSNGLSISADTQVLSLALATSTTTGALSSADWNKFNAKQNALINPITGIVEAGRLVKGASAGEVTYSTITEDNNGNIGMINLDVKSITDTYSFMALGNDSLYGVRLGTDSTGIPVIQGANKQGDEYKNIAIQPEGGVVLIGFNTASSDSKLQVAGTITAAPADKPSEVVVKAQLDGKLDSNVGALELADPLEGDEHLIIEQDGEAKRLEISAISGGVGGMSSISIVIDKTIEELGLSNEATNAEIEQAFKELLVTLPPTTFIDDIQYSVIYLFRLIEM
jgi:hypothetical protein